MCSQANENTRLNLWIFNGDLMEPLHQRFLKLMFAISFNSATNPLLKKKKLFLIAWSVFFFFKNSMMFLILCSWFWKNVSTKKLFSKLSYDIFFPHIIFSLILYTPCMLGFRILLFDIVIYSSLLYLMEALCKLLLLFKYASSPLIS